MKLAPLSCPPNIPSLSNLHILSHISPLKHAGRINCCSASPEICFTLRGSKPGGGGGYKAVMCFHRGLLSLGKCNRLEYQWDVPESVTAHLLSDRGFGTVSLRSGGRPGFLQPPSVPCFPANILTLNKSRRRTAPTRKTQIQAVRKKWSRLSVPIVPLQGQ